MRLVVNGEINFPDSMDEIERVEVESRLFDDIETLLDDYSDGSDVYVAVFWE